MAFFPSHLPKPTYGKQSAVPALSATPSKPCGFSVCCVAGDDSRQNGQGQIEDCAAQAEHVGIQHLALMYSRAQAFSGRWTSVGTRQHHCTEAQFASTSPQWFRTLFNHFTPS